MKRMVCLALVAMLCLALAPFSALAEETIKVGIIMDLTGPNSEWGSAQAWGAQYACEQYNANGGINGYMLEPIVMDCASDAQTAVSAYRQLVDEYEVNVIIGPAISSNVIPMAPLAEEDQICVVGHFQDDRCTANEETG
ncbi:MAG: ABC transporter substrate-binding protein, partial [Clostridiales bacterium]|nr:ABC transporter substrate-binding protein [Clostridiales bacterium]